MDDNKFTVRVKYHDIEMESSFPAEKRSQISFEKDGSGTAIIKLIESMSDNIVKMLEARNKQ